MKRAGVYAALLCLLGLANGCIEEGWETDQSSPPEARSVSAVAWSTDEPLTGEALALVLDSTAASSAGTDVSPDGDGAAPSTAAAKPSSEDSTIGRTDDPSGQPDDEGELSDDAAGEPSTGRVYRDVAPGEYIEDIFHQERNRRYRVHVPSSYDPTQPTPLLFFFHAGGHTGRQAATLGFVEQAEERGVILVAPNGLWNAWEAFHCCLPDYIDDVDFVDSILAQVENHLNIDPERIYASGASAGAMFSHRIGSDRSDVFAAIALGTGSVGGREDWQAPLQMIHVPDQPISILAMHGRRDRRVPYYGEELLEENGRIDIGFERGIRTWAEYNECDPHPVLTVTAWGEIAEFVDCAGGVEVVGIVDDDLGHAFPRPSNSEIYGAAVALEFLLRHTLSEP